MKRGLVFGKFLPLHRGHQLLIDTALSQVDDLTIVVYDSRRPDDERMPIELRRRWLRELWEAQDLKGTFADHLKMGRRQRDREDAAARHSRRFLFCDTNAWTTLQWSLRSYGTADARLHELVDRTVGDYTWFLCDNDFDWVQDGTREMAGGESDRFQEQHVRDLERREIPYTTVGGSVEERVAEVKRVLGVA